MVERLKQMRYIALLGPPPARRIEEKKWYRKWYSRGVSMCINRGSVSARAARTGRGVRGPS